MFPTMKWLVAVGAAVFLVGCAQDFVATPIDASAGKDFSAVGGGGQADMAMPDLLALDLTTPPAPDLSSHGCDLSTGAPVSTLYFAGATSQNTLETASFTVGGGWSPVAVDGTSGVSEVAIAIAPSAPVVVAKQNDAGSTLSYSSYNACGGGYPALTSAYPGAVSSVRPSLVGVSTGNATVDALVRGVGSDNHLYHAAFDGNTWSHTQLMLLTDKPAAAVRSASTLHAIHVGTGAGGTTVGQIFDATPQGTSTPIGNATSNLAPAAVAGTGGTIYVVFTGMDTNLYWSKLPAGGSTWTAPAQLCAGQGAGCLDATDLGPVLTLGANGSPIVAWHGKNIGTPDNHLYTSTLTDGATPAWSAAIEATGGETTALQPALSTGIGGAQAELVYVRATDGLPRHVRLTTTWGSATTIGTTGQSATPALASQP
jgi:hypothetical protein